MAVLLLTDIVLGLWFTISFIRAIAAVVISVSVLILIIPIVALICKEGLVRQSY